MGEREEKGVTGGGGRCDGGALAAAAAKEARYQRVLRGGRCAPIEIGISPDATTTATLGQALRLRLLRRAIGKGGVSREGKRERGFSGVCACVRWMCV